MAKSIQDISAHYFKRFPDFSINIAAEDFAKNLQTIIVIPCFKEAAIIQSLHSLANCDRAKHNTLVLILVNASEAIDANIKAYNEKTFQDIQTFIEQNKSENLTFKAFLNNELPTKHAGVGYARKILMDTALSMFSKQDTDGIIVNTDADCLFTKNYITAIENAFENTKAKHGVMHYEHRIDSEENKILVQGITEYELHLRYYKQALAWTNYPKVIHTIGSCMLCKATTYALEGGMNKRKAGEDFYFMNKLAKSHEFVEVKNASVLPSCRTSDRVPFGTGKAMNDYIDTQTKVFQSYDFRCFIELNEFISKIDLLYSQNFKKSKNQFSDLSFQFFEAIEIDANLLKIKKQSKDLVNFKKNFFFWFDHLKALQFIHFYTDNKYPKISIFDAAHQFLERKEINIKQDDARSILELFRTLDK
tara:strand:+ start:8 stop:1264 length:1257 start_codon:yes stop_codon:yes gene_type:complete